MAKYEVQVLVDNKVVLTQRVSEEMLDEKFYPLMEEAAEQLRGRHRYHDWDNLSDSEKAALSQSWWL